MLLPLFFMTFSTFLVFSLFRIFHSRFPSDSPKNSSNRIKNFGGGEESVFPVGRRQLAIGVARVGLGEALALETVVGEARLVADPLLVDFLVDARQNAVDFAYCGENKSHPG